MSAARSPGRPRWRIVASNLKGNAVATLRFRAGRVDSDIGATHASLSTERSVAYVRRVYADYLSYGGLSPADFAGRTVLELGPGDNLGVALLFHAAGAATVIALDKFRARRDPEQQRRIYRALRDGLGAAARARFDAAIDLDGDLATDPARVRYVWGVEAEAADRELGAASVDLVVSRAVLWEIQRLAATLAALTRALRPGGRMAHKTACEDFMFRPHGHHRLEFLTIPDWLYRALASGSGHSNRRTAGAYRAALEALGHDVEIHVVRVGGRDAELPPGVTRLVRGVHFAESDVRDVEAIRPRLQPRFRALPVEELLAEDLFVVTRRR